MLVMRYYVCYTQTNTHLAQYVEKPVMVYFFGPICSSTEDRHHYITVRVHLCLQHDRRDAVLRAGLSAIAETC